MATRQIVVVVGVVLVTALAAVVPAVGAAALAGDGVSGPPSDIGDGFAQTTADGTNETDATNETQFGTQMAAFMQSNAAQVNDSVEDGMWEAAFERANESERARMAQQRAGALEARLDALAAQNHTLYQRYRNGSISEEEYVVQASQLTGRMEALQGGVEGTARAAERAGLNVSALAELRNSAKNLTGPEVAGVARGLVDGDTGPPAGVPGRASPGESGTERPGNGPPDDGPGGPDGDSGTETPAANATENGNQGAGEGGPPDDPGNQSAGTPGGGSGNQSGGQGQSDGADGGTDPPGGGPGNSSGEGPPDGNGDGGPDGGNGNDAPGEGNDNDGPAAGSGGSGNSSGGSGSNGNGPEDPGGSDGDGGNDGDDAGNGSGAAPGNGNDGSTGNGNDDSVANGNDGSAGNDNDDSAGNGGGQGNAGAGPPSRLAGAILLTVWP